MFGLGTTELIVIGVIVFLIFGAKRLPEIGKGLGGALREFKQVKKEITSEEPSGEDREPEKPGEKTIEGKLTEKVMEQVPGVKQVVNAKKKVEKVKNFVDS